MRTKLREGERKILETRAHWITVAKPFLLFLLATVLVILSFILMKEPGGFRSLARWVCLILWVVAGLYFAYCEWFRRRDIWAVTNLRVIDEQGVFTLYSKESSLEKINNISYRQTIPGRLLKYGDVEIQTAAEQGATTYRKVLRPKLLKDTIARSRDEYGQEVKAIHSLVKEASADKKSGEETRVCPSCAESVKAEAKVCRHCGRDLPPLHL
jgi:uncharacterized membrane protein YdbT with pleckstrin-like domain